MIHPEEFRVPSPLSPDDRRRRRAALRRHHPDLGGDPEEFARTLRAWESPSRDGSEIRFVHRPRGLRGLLSRWRQRRSRRSAPPRVV